ncbi:hypothetical protein ACLBPO_10970 [Klebsiella pneumoniae]
MESRKQKEKKAKCT